MISVLVAAALSTATSADMPLIHVSESTPPLTCVIKMPDWCITPVGGAISMTDEGEIRRWTLQSKVFMKEGPLIILENKACGASNRLNPKLLKREVVQGPEGKPLNSVQYKIAEGGCTLEFRWPVLSHEDGSYEETMRYGILIGDTQRMQLDQVSK